MTETATPAGTAANFRDYVELTKPRLSLLSVLTALVGYLAARPPVDWLHVVLLMVGTSLAMAPAMLLTPRAKFVDLDGPLLLARDREPGLVYDGSLVLPPAAELWG